jgi:hypothetical protein
MQFPSCSGVDQATAAEARAVDAVAHAAHTQAAPRSPAGTRASSAALNVVWVHQHGVSRRPLAAAAHAFAPPQCGQVKRGAAAPA